VSPKTYSLWRLPELVLGSPGARQTVFPTLDGELAAISACSVILVAVAVSVVPALEGKLRSVDCVD